MSFPVTPRSEVRRRPQRAAYDEASVYAVLDAHVLGHVGYAIDGQPFVTPTSYWREGRTLYWHGSAMGRAIAASTAGLPVCLTVSFLDGFLVGRSGIAHSLQYRSVMAFGHARLIEDRAAKRAAMHAFLDRLYPGRSATLRPVTDVELDLIHVVEMPIEEASAKTRTDGVADRPADHGWDAWCGVLPVEIRMGAPAAQDGMGSGGPLPVSLAHLAEGKRLDAALAAYSGLPVST